MTTKRESPPSAAGPRWLTAPEAFDLLETNKVELSGIHHMTGLWYARQDGLDWRPLGPYLRDGREAWCYVAAVKVVAPSADGQNAPGARSASPEPTL